MSSFEEETESYIEERKKNAEIKRAAQAQKRTQMFIGAGILVVIIIIIGIVVSSCGGKKNTKSIETTKVIETTVAPTTIQVTTAVPGVMYTTDTVNLRKGADKNSDIIKTIKKGKQVTVISTEGKWCSVSYGTDTGFVMKKYLSVTKK